MVSQTWGPVSPGRGMGGKLLSFIVLILIFNILFAETRIVFSKHTFRTRDTSCRRIRRYTYDDCYFLVRHSLGSVQDERDGIIPRHACQRLSNMLPFRNLRNTPTIGRQVGIILLEAGLTLLTIGFAACERPPGYAL